MDISQLKKDAQCRMERWGRKPNALTFFSIAISVAAAIVVGIVSTAVSGYRGGDGLSAMDKASLFQALDEFLNLTVQVLSPFWAVGLVAALFAFANGQDASRDTLLLGFRRFFPFLRLYLLKTMFVVSVATLVCLPAMLIYSVTPWAIKLQQMVAANPDVLDNMELLTKEMLAFGGIYCVMLLAVLVPLLYRLRFADYFMISGWKSAMMAMATSFRLTKGQVMNLFKLDVSFWWFYLGRFALIGICYLDVVVGLFGYRLNMNPQALFWVCYLCYAIGHLALETYARPKVEGAHALLFLKTAQPPMTQSPEIV